MQVALRSLKALSEVTAVQGAGGLVGRCNADRASEDKDPHWCQAVIYVVGGHGNTGKHLLADDEVMLSDTLQTAETVCLCCRLVFQLCATRLIGGKDRVTVL